VVFFVLLFLILGFVTGGIGWIPLILLILVKMFGGKKSSRTETKPRSKTRKKQATIVVEPPLLGSPIDEKDEEVQPRDDWESGPKRPERRYCTWSDCSAFAVGTQYCAFHAKEHDKFVKRQCGTKRKHRTREDAELHKLDIELKDGIPYNVYQCKVCSTFHVGHIQ